MEPFSCQRLHSCCDCKPCQHQNHGLLQGGQKRGTISDLRRSAEAGCKTCTILLSGLNLPEIRNIWETSIEQALKARRASPLSSTRSAEDAVPLDLLWDESKSRLVVRTLASQSSHEWRHFNFNSLSTANEFDCKAIPALKVFPTHHTASEESYQHLKTWIDDCDRSHSCVVRSPPRLPKRVLKISDNCVVLHLTTGEHDRYTTLSHTWGFNTTFILTLEKEGTPGSLDAFTRGIPWTSIPKTFQNAIQISRELDIKYLWIDSVCIIQNSPEDWEEQSREMGAIYGNSWLNIAATDSKNSHGGCFRRSNLPQKHSLQHLRENPKIVVMHQPIHTHKDFGSNYPTTTTSPPLLQRGWVFQERLLSSRVVYYAKDELLWECKETTDCQCGGATVVARNKTYYHQAIAGKRDSLPFTWMKMANRYSGLNFTFPEKDRLIALAGVAKAALDSNRAGHYLAGHWSQELASQLCWTVANTWRRPEHYLAPSWSWLSVFGQIQSLKYEYDSHVSTPPLIDVSITSTSCDPSGSAGLTCIKSAEIVLSGRMLHMQAEVLDAPRNQRARYRLWHRRNSIEYTDFKPDYIMSPKEATGIDGVCVLFWGKIWDHDRAAYLFKFMVLQLVPAKSNTFQRLGLFSLSSVSESQEAEKLVGACEFGTGIHIV